MSGMHTGMTGQRMRAASIAAVCVAACVMLAGCGEDVKVIRYDPFLAGLPGAEGGQPPVGERPVIPDDPHGASQDQLMVKRPDGGVTFVAKVTRHLIAHLGKVLESEDDRLLYDELVSAQTKAHFEAQGRDPRAEVSEFVKENRTDIYALLARMPSGERTPGVQLVKVGPKSLRLTITGTSARGLKLTELWVVMENGNWRLWWFA